VLSKIAFNFNLRRYAKDFEPLAGVKYMLREFIPKLTHGTEGIENKHSPDIESPKYDNVRQSVTEQKQKQTAWTNHWLEFESERFDPSF